MPRCSNCDGAVTDEAFYCPNCGSKMISRNISPLAAILVMILIFVIQLFVVVPLYFIDLPLENQLISAIGEMIFLLVPLIYMLHRRVNVKEFVMFGRLKDIVAGLGLGAGLLGLSLILGIVLAFFLGASTAVEETNREIIAMSKQSPVSIMLLVSIAGICEEFAFRGFLQSAFKNRYSLPVALAGASLAFGLFHFDPQAIYIIDTFIVGLYLGYFYNKFRSYVMTATAHAVYNLIAFGLLVLV